MHIALIGYGKMGKTIEQLALAKGHQLTILDVGDDIRTLHEKKPDAAIEFTTPGAAPANIRACLEMSIPVVCGTTGWLEHKPEIERICKEVSGTFFYASNYSLGVNLFFRLNQILAKMMSDQSGYRTAIHEIHHTQKKDAPSGTAITLAQDILKVNKTYTEWSTKSGPGLLQISSERKDPFPGTHTITYSSGTDEISITHTAHSREGFASGALAVAEWIPGRKGLLSMDDFLRLDD